MTLPNELWSIKDIATFMGFCTNHVRYKVVVQEGFPEAMYLTASKRNARYDAGQVRQWVADRREDSAA